MSKRQEGNPLLKHMKNVRWQWADIVPDYQMGLACALFLSLRCVPPRACSLCPARRGLAAGRRAGAPPSGGGPVCLEPGATRLRVPPSQC